MSETEPHVPARPADAAAPDTPGAGPPGRPSLGWTELVVGIVAYLVLSVCVTLLVIGVLKGPPSTVATVALTGFTTLLAVTVTIRVRVRSLAALGVRAVSARWLLVGLGGGVAAYLVNRLVVLAYAVLTGDHSNPQANLTGAATGTGWELAGLLLTGAVLVPVAEELLFRGVGFGSLRRHGVVIATIVSAVLFGLAHGLNAVLPAAVVLGVINALLYERSRSIWPSVMSHATNNALAFVLAAIFVS